MIRKDPFSEAGESPDLVDPARPACLPVLVV